MVEGGEPGCEWREGSQGVSGGGIEPGSEWREGNQGVSGGRGGVEEEGVDVKSRTMTTRVRNYIGKISRAASISVTQLSKF